MRLNKKWIKKDNTSFSSLSHFSPSQLHYVDMSNIVSHPAIPAYHHYVLLFYLYTCYQWTVNVLSNHPRWIFKKNLMEFFVGLQPYLYYYYSGCTLESHNHMFFPECSMITWPCHVIWLTESPSYLYPYSIVCFEVLD